MLGLFIMGGLIVALMTYVGIASRGPARPELITPPDYPPPGPNDP